MESKWRENVPGLGLAEGDWLMIARKLAGPFPGQYYAKRRNGQKWWITITTAASGAMNVTMHNLSTFSFWTLVQGGIIEPDHP